MALNSAASCNSPASAFRSHINTLTFAAATAPRILKVILCEFHGGCTAVRPPQSKSETYKTSRI